MTTSLITKQIFDQITALCSMGVSIAKVDNEFFTFLTFIPSTSGNTSSVDFVTINGICISEFIMTTRYDATVRQEAYFQQFERYIQDKTSVTIKFNKQIPYFIFSK